MPVLKSSEAAGARATRHAFAAAIGLSLAVHLLLLSRGRSGEAAPQAPHPAVDAAVEVELVRLTEDAVAVPSVAAEEPESTSLAARPPVRNNAVRDSRREIAEEARRRASGRPPPGPVPDAKAEHSGSVLVSPPGAKAGDSRAWTQGSSQGEGSGEKGRRLSPEQLGLAGGVMRTAFADLQEREEQPPSNDAAQLRQELLDADTRAGLGAGWELAALVRRVVTNQAPLGSTATFSFEVAASGAVTGIALQAASSARAQWLRLLERLRQQIVQLQRVPAGPLTAILELSNRSTKRGGGSKRWSDFDVSNIGSPWMQQLNVRVLRQISR